MTNDHNNLIDSIESIIDKHGTNRLCNLIAEVCSAKADHIRETWQDETTASAWDREAARFLGLSVNQPRAVASHVVQP
jgi:hypothetical protein